MIARNDIGDKERLSAAFFDETGAPGDPSAVSLVIRWPDGTESVQTYNPGDIVRDAEGAYHYDITYTMPGRLVFWWDAEGVLQTVAGDTRDVRDPAEGGTPWLPAVSDVASLLSRRWREAGGTYADGPTPNTTPSLDHVDRVIAMQASLVRSATGDLSGAALVCADADSVRTAVASVIAARAALVLEGSFWPEEVADAGRDLTAGWARADADQAAVVEAVRECKAGAVEPGGGEGEGGTDIAPVFAFEQQSQRLSF